MSFMMPLKHADTTKQNFYDFILTVSGSQEVPLLVHGDYDTLYKKIINCELICGCKILVAVTPDGVPIAQQRFDLSSVSIYRDGNGRIRTISNRPLINIVGDFLIDCNNVVYEMDDPDIPFDDRPGEVDPGSGK